MNILPDYSTIPFVLDKEEKSSRHYLGKRLLDLCVALLGLIVLSPVMLLVAVTIFFSMGRPIYFRQQRPGLNGKPFEMLKFRTMDDSKDEHGKLVQDTLRITRIGSILRKTSLDELPELFNVLRGEMSLIGPRPLLMEYLDRYSKEQARRHEVLPGITGWAQVCGRNGISWEEKFELDVWYVDNLSLGIDFKILMMTLPTVLSSKGVNASSQETMSEFKGSSLKLLDGIHNTNEEKPKLVESEFDLLKSAYNENNQIPIESASSDVAMPSERVYLSPPHMSQKAREMLLDAFDSNWIAPLGPHVDAFEREFAAKIGIEHAVALSSGTAALHLALMSLGIRAGDEVATATLTFIATANAIKYTGATPVFIDCEPKSWNIDPNLLADELENAFRRGKPIKAVIAVDLFGQCADYHPIREVCRFYEVPLIEDAAESLGATYAGQSAGTLGDIGCFSFNGNKIITTSGGGMLVTHRQDIADKVRHLSTQAKLSRSYYEHSEVGYNYRLSNLLAAIGLAQLEVLEDRVEKRRINFHHYSQALSDVPGISFIQELDHGKSTHWLTCIKIDPKQFGRTREEVRLALEEKNIESRPVWKPMHLQLPYRNCSIRGGNIAKQIFENGLCLPSGSDLDFKDLLQVVSTIRDLSPLADKAMQRFEIDKKIPQKS